MIKSFACLLATFAVAFPTCIHAADFAPETNVLQLITINLTFVCNNKTNGAYATEVPVITAGDKHSYFAEMTTNITRKSMTYSVNTTDLINILTTNTAPKGSTLVQVNETNNSAYVAVRHNGTNVLVLDGQLLFNQTEHVAFPSYTDIYTPTGETSIGDVDELMVFRISTPSLALDSIAQGKRVYATPFRIGPILRDNFTDTINVACLGSNYLGTNQIVTGTVTVGSSVIGN